MGSVDRAAGMNTRYQLPRNHLRLTHTDQPRNSFAVRGWHRSSGRKFQKRRGQRSSPNELDEFYTTIVRAISKLSCVHEVAWQYSIDATFRREFPEDGM